MVIDIHPHAKLYSFLLSCTVALGFSFGTTQLLSSFVPEASSKFLGILYVILFFLLWRETLSFLVAHCLRKIDLRTNGFCIETLTEDQLFVDFSQLRSLRLRTFRHRCLLTLSFEHNGVLRQQFVYFSTLNLEPKTIEQFNAYLQHNISQRS